MTLIITVAAGVGVFLMVAFLRMKFGIALRYFIVGLYGLVFLLACFVPAEFLAVAFDSGGVASGPMTTTFLLPFSMGACEALGGNVLTDAFGIVAMVAMTPLLTIQTLGLLYRFKQKDMPQDTLAADDEDSIIVLEGDT